MIFAKILESEKRNVIVGIRFDGHIRELLNWAIVKVAEPGDRVIALHVCRNAGMKIKFYLFYFTTKCVVFVLTLQLFYHFQNQLQTLNRRWTLIYMITIACVIKSRFFISFLVTDTIQLSLNCLLSFWKIKKKHRF